MDTVEKIINFYFGTEPIIIENVLNTLIVIGTYFFVCVIYPSMCLYPIVKNKSFAFRFSFYQMCAIFYMNIIGYILAYAGFFSDLSIQLCIYLIPLFIRCFISRREIINGYKLANGIATDILMRTYGIKSLVRRIFYAVLRKVTGLYTKYVRGHIFEYSVLLFVLFNLFMYFGNTKFTYGGYRYATPDEEVHLNWIVNLFLENPFVDGLYPYSMHLSTAVFSAISPLDLYQTYLALGPSFLVFNTFVFYVVFRELIGLRYPLMFGMAFMIIADILDLEINLRLQYAVPMEFGFNGLFIAIYAFITYIKKPDWTTGVLLGFSVFAVVSAHFYTAFFLIFMFIPIGLFYFIKIIKKKILVKLIIIAVASGVISVAPYILGLVVGYEFNGSMAWAISMMSGGSGGESAETDDSTATYDTIVSEDTATLSDGTKVFTNGTTDLSNGTMLLTDGTTSTQTDETGTEDNAEAESVVQEEVVEEDKGFDLEGKWNSILLSFANYTYSSQWISAITILLCVAFMIYGLIGIIVKIIKSKIKWKILQRIPTSRSVAYFLFALMYLSLAFFMMGKTFGIPELMNVDRYAAILFYMAMPVYMFPLAVIYDLLEFVFKNKNRSFYNRIILILMCPCILAIFYSGYIKWDRRHQSTLTVDEGILAEYLVNNLDRQTWTVVTNTRLLTLITGNGFHYEVIDLMNVMIDGKDELYIPTEEIYIIAEKRWLNDPGYVNNEIYGDLWEYVYVNEGMALDMGLESYDGAEPSRIYVDFRPELMARLYYWVQKIEEVYPDEISKIYESEDTILYRVEQDPYFLLNLSLDFMSGLEAPEIVYDEEDTENPQEENEDE